MLSMLRDYVSQAFSSLLGVLGSWEEDTASLDLEYVIGTCVVQKCADGATRWVPEAGLRIDLAGKSNTTVVARFAQSDGLVCMGLSTSSLESLITKMRGLCCTSLALPMGLEDKTLLQDCQSFVANLSTTTPFLSNLHLDLDQKDAFSFADAEMAFNSAVNGLFNMSRQLRHLHLTNVANPGQFLFASQVRGGARDAPAWPDLLSFEISGFYVKTRQVQLVRRAATTAVVRKMCPKIAGFKVAMIVWPKAGRASGAEDFAIDTRFSLIVGNEW